MCVCVVEHVALLFAGARSSELRLVLSLGTAMVTALLRN